MPTGSIIAATVCSPINEAKTPDVTEIPRQIRDVRVPVIRTSHQAIRLSNFCLTTATANIKEPIINSTESVIRLFATFVESIPNNKT